jgi:hypothetical protein
MFAFDWSLKEIANLKNNPSNLPFFFVFTLTISSISLTFHFLCLAIENELTNSQLIFWFYVSSQYFPFRAVQMSQLPVEAFVEPILEKLKPNINNKL